MTSSPVRLPFLLASIFGATGVALGAFGAHALNSYFDANPSQAATYETAVQYHLIHAVALLGTTALVAYSPSKWVRWAGWLFAIGIILFSGSLYILSLANLRFMGAVAPIGGIALILGWVFLGIGAWRISL